MLSDAAARRVMNVKHQMLM